MNRQELISKFIEFANRKTKLTLKRYNEIILEWNETTDKGNKGKITAAEAAKIHQTIMKETAEAQIRFDNEGDFRNFSNLLANIGIPLPHIFQQVEHEIEHSKPYKKEGINSYLGWHKFFVPTKIKGLQGGNFQPFHKPFGEKYDSLSSFEKDNLLYKSMKAVSSLSEGDKKATKELEKMHGNKIKNEN